MFTSWSVCNCFCCYIRSYWHYAFAQVDMSSDTEWDLSDSENETTGKVELSVKSFTKLFGVESQFERTARKSVNVFLYIVFVFVFAYMYVCSIRYFSSAWNWENSEEGSVKRCKKLSNSENHKQWRMKAWKFLWTKRTIVLLRVSDEFQVCLENS